MPPVVAFTKELEEIDSFEHNLPVRLDARRKLLKELWAARKALS